jgi:hypothetical protein
MNTELAILRASLNLRGHRFKEGSMIKVWNTGQTIQIQPAVCKDKYHAALWYSMPHIHLRDLVFLEKPLEELHQIGII